MNALRRLATHQTSKTFFQSSTKRTFAGGHGHPPPKYEGFELTFRTYLPESHHVSTLLLLMGYKRSSLVTYCPASFE